LTASRLPERRSIKTALTELRRAVREALGRCEFGKAEAAMTVERLGTACAFCDDPAVLWAFLFPMRSGGEMVLGNMVPACAACAASKGEQELEAWLLRPSSVPRYRGVPDLDGRVRRLRDHMQHCGYVPRSLQDRLGVEGMREFMEYASREHALRMGIRQLVAGVRSRAARPRS
jgi:hypothetical protein